MCHTLTRKGIKTKSPALAYTAETWHPADAVQVFS